MRKLLFLLFALFCVSAASNVKISAYVLNIGKIDYSTGTFTADFYLDFICPDNSCQTNSFEFSNGRASSVDEIINTTNESFYRIFGTFASNLDFQRFPFDEQQIQIKLEDKIQTTDTLNYVWDTSQSGLDSQVLLSGWNFKQWNATTSNHFYPPYNQTYSQAVFSMDLEKPRMNSFAKTFLPILFIVLITLLSFLMDVDKTGTRIGIASGALTASVLFHISIANQLPAITYLTYADKIMILTYGFLLFSLIVAVGFSELVENGKKELAERIHKKLQYNIFWIIPLIYFIAFLLF